MEVTLHGMKNGFIVSLISVVNTYKYLGICLSTRLTFSRALKDMAACAKIGVVNILKLLWSLREKSALIFFKLFDVQIQPILNYGAEAWGLEADLKVVERIHLFALKRLLNVSSRTPNVMVYGETGRIVECKQPNSECYGVWWNWAVPSLCQHFL